MLPDSSEIPKESIVAMLDSIDIAVIMFAEDTSVLLWNRALLRFFPQLEDLLSEPITYFELLVKSYELGVIKHSFTPAEIKAHAQGVVDRARTISDGPPRVRTVETVSGLTLEARDFCTPGGEFIATRTDVTEARQKERQLELLNVELKKANEGLRRFSAVAAHDLRAPLRALSVLPGWIREGLVDVQGNVPSEILDDLELMERQSKRMDALVKDLLAYSRLDDRATTPEEFDPAHRVLDIANLILPEHAFHLDVSCKTQVIRVNPIEFDIVMRNLFSNSVKHHDLKKGRITVRSWPEGEDALFEVSDDGPGIPAEFRTRVFEEFQTLRPKEETATSGLGLSFVQRIVERWGGQVQIIDRADTRGTTVRFSIPGALAQANAAGFSSTRNSE